MVLCRLVCGGVVFGGGVYASAAEVFRQFVTLTHIALVGLRIRANEDVEYRSN